MDFLLFHMQLLGHIHTCKGDIYYPSFHIEYIPGVVKLSTEGKDILIRIFYNSTSNISYHIFTCVDYLYYPHLYMKYFSCVEKFQQGDNHPCKDFLKIYI